MEPNYALVRTLSIIIFIYIARLIYSHKLRIGYSWLLFLLGIGFFLLSVWPGAISLVNWLTGSTSWVSNILFFMVVFLFIIVVHITIMISSLTDRVKELGQQIAISFAEIDEKNLNKLINSLKKISTNITLDMIPTETAKVSHDTFSVNEEATVTIEGITASTNTHGQKGNNIHKSMPDTIDISKKPLKNI